MESVYRGTGRKWHLVVLYFTIASISLTGSLCDPLNRETNIPQRSAWQAKARVPRQCLSASASLVNSLVTSTDRAHHLLPILYHELSCHGLSWMGGQFRHEQPERQLCKIRRLHLHSAVRADMVIVSRHVSTCSRLSARPLITTNRASGTCGFSWLCSATPEVEPRSGRDLLEDQGHTWPRTSCKPRSGQIASLHSWSKSNHQASLPGYCLTSRCSRYISLPATRSSH